MTTHQSTHRFIQYSTTCTLTLASSFAASAAQPFASALTPTSNSIAQTIFRSSMAAASQRSTGAFQARVFTGTNSNNAQTLQVTDTDGSGTIDGGDLGLMLLNMGASADDIAVDSQIDSGNEPSSLVASVAGAQGLYAKNYIVTEGGVDYSVMDVYLKFNSAVGVGSNGERVVNFFGQVTTDVSTYGVTKVSKYANSSVTGMPIQRISVNNGGAGYTSAPTVTITGGGGTGAIATAILTGSAVTSVTIDNPGTGYTSAPTLTFSGGGATKQAYATATFLEYQHSNESWLPGPGVTG
ncbi:MAG: hypothetical protein WCQ03_09095, partial [Phycisphaerae bacterium]